MLFRKNPEPKSWFKELVLLNGTFMVITSANLILLGGVSIFAFFGLLLGFGCVYFFTS